MGVFIRHRDVHKCSDTMYGVQIDTKRNRMYKLMNYQTGPDAVDVGCRRYCWEKERMKRKKEEGRGKKGIL